MNNDFSVLLQAEIDKASKAKLNNEIKNMASSLAPIKIKIDTSEITKSIGNAIKNAYSQANPKKSFAKSASAQVPKNDDIQYKIDVGEYEASIERLRGQYAKWGMSIDEVNSKMRAVDATYKTMVNTKPGDARIDAEKRFQTELKKTKNDIVKNGAFSASPIQTQNLSNKIQKWLDLNTRASDTARTSLEGYLNSLKQGNVNLSNFKRIEQQFKNIDAAERSAGRLGKTFLGSIKDMSLKFGTWIGASRIVMASIQGLENMANSVRELDAALVDLKKTTTMTASQLEDFYYSANDTAKQMGVTTKEIIDQASAWSRLNKKIGLLYGNI